MAEDKQIEIYLSDDGQTQIQVRLEKDTIWLSQAQMAELFEKDSDTIGLHLRNIYNSDELERSATTEDSSVVRQEGKRHHAPIISLPYSEILIKVFLENRLIQR